jgi:hypothetical protein
MPKANARSRATAPVLQRGWLDKCGGCGGFKISVREETSLASKKPEKHFLYVPCAERPMVSVHWIGEVARFSTRQCVPQEALRFESKSNRGGALVSFEQDQTEARWCVRVWILLLVVMDCEEVKNEHCILRDVHPVVNKVFGGKVRWGCPKRRVGAHHLRRETSLRSEAQNVRVLQRTSFMMARMYGRCCSSSALGQVSRTSTLSSSAWARA